jgi:glycosyltransferase involved in cell wall biosynthesis
MVKSTYLFVLPWSIDNPGGVDQVVVNLYRHFLEDGDYHPRLLVPSWQHRNAEVTTESGLSVDYMRVRSPLSDASVFRSLVAWSVTLIPELRSITHYLRRNRVAVVNVHFPSLGALQFILVKRLFMPRLKVILSFHGMDIVNAATTNGMERRLWQLLLRTADACVGCSHALTRAIPEFHARVKHAVTIHNGLDIDHFMQERNAGAVLNERLAHRPFLLSVAALEHKKGLDTLLRAFRLVRERADADIALALVGPDRGAGFELRQLAKELGLEESVVFCGEVPHADLHVYYAQAMVFCLASRLEPFGIVLLEAGAFRLPVIATSVGGIQEILDHGRTGRLVPVDVPEALAREILDLVQAPTERARLGKELFDHVSRHFSWGRAYQQYLELCSP